MAKPKNKEIDQKLYKLFFIIFYILLYIIFLIKKFEYLTK